MWNSFVSVWLIWNRWIWTLWEAGLYWLVTLSLVSVDSAIHSQTSVHFSLPIWLVIAHLFWDVLGGIQIHSATFNDSTTSFICNWPTHTTWRHGPAWALLNRKYPLETQHVSVLPLPFIHVLANYITPFILWLIVFMKFLIYVHIHTGYVFSYFFYNVPLLFFCNPSWLDHESTHFEPRWSTLSQSWSLKPPISNTWRRTPGFFTKIGWEQTAKRAKHI
jgi:hypothetical protein